MDFQSHIDESGIQDIEIGGNTALPEEKSWMWLKILIGVVAVGLAALLWFTSKAAVSWTLYEDALCYLDKEYGTDISPIDEPRRTPKENAQLAYRYMNKNGIEGDYDLVFMMFHLGFSNYDSGGKTEIEEDGEKSEYTGVDSLMEAASSFEFWKNKTNRTSLYPVEQ